jgi:hypothetical protein
MAASAEDIIVGLEKRTRRKKEEEKKGRKKKSKVGYKANLMTEEEGGTKKSRGAFDTHSRGPACFFFFPLGKAEAFAGKKRYKSFTRPRKGAGSARGPPEAGGEDEGGRGGADFGIDGSFLPLLCLFVWRQWQWQRRSWRRREPDSFLPCQPPPELFLRFFWKKKLQKNSLSLSLSNCFR